MQRQILVLMDVTEEQKQRLMALAPQAHFTFASRKTLTREMAQQAHIILGNPGSEMIRGSRNLQFLQLSSAGCENYVREGVLSPEVVLANATGTFGPNISEYMLAVTLMHLRNLHLYRDNQRAQLWRDEGPARSLDGAVVLVLGAGDIGSHYAARVKAMGATTIGVRRTIGRGDPAIFDQMHTMEKIDQLLPQADIVAMALPSTPQTVHLLDERRMALMKQDALLINVGRGNAIDTDALCRMLDAGKFSGVALDVTDPEPLPPSHRLWEYRRVTITPHNTGGRTHAVAERRFAVCYENLARFLRGEAVCGVDRQTGYRKSDV